jgi:peptide/nickel transport system permease protein
MMNNLKDEQKVTSEEQIINESDLMEKSLADSVRIVSPGQMVMRRFFRSKLSMVGLVMLILLFAFSFFGPLFSPWGEVKITGDYKWVTSVIPHQITVTEINEETGEEENVVYKFFEVSDPYKVYSKTPVSWQHILGTDQYGYDVLTRLMYGGQVSLDPAPAWPRRCRRRPRR